jgi:hypothetical protein
LEPIWKNLNSKFLRVILRAKVFCSENLIEVSRTVKFYADFRSVEKNRKQITLVDKKMLCENSVSTLIFLFITAFGVELFC